MVAEIFPHKSTLVSDPYMDFHTTKNSPPPNVADPNPDPSDPYFFGPPGSGSGSISQRHPGPSIIQQKCKKNIDSYYFVTFFLSLRNDLNVPSKSNKQKNYF